ncbi:MAG: GrpB family protein [Acidobacteria bacterium]|nr:GrpB family protein [Acidobacteriota bacterium]
MVESSFNDHWDRLYFRDYLIENPDIARQYEKLKIQLSAASDTDRVTYTRGKTEFIARVTKQAKQFYGKLSG